MTHIPDHYTALLVDFRLVVVVDAPREQDLVLISRVGALALLTMSEESCGGPWG
jgi:hypothetical protein